MTLKEAEKILEASGSDAWRTASANELEYMLAWIDYRTRGKKKYRNQVEKLTQLHNAFTTVIEHRREQEKE